MFLVYLTACRYVLLKITGFKHLTHRTTAGVDLFPVRKLHSYSVHLIIYFSFILLYFGFYSDCLKVVVRKVEISVVSDVVCTVHHHYTICI